MAEKPIDMDIADVREDIDEKTVIMNWFFAITDAGRCADNAHDDAGYLGQVHPQEPHVLLVPRAPTEKEEGVHTARYTEEREMGTRMYFEQRREVARQVASIGRRPMNAKNCLATKVVCESGTQSV